MAEPTKPTKKAYFKWYQSPDTLFVEVQVSHEGNKPPSLSVSDDCFTYHHEGSDAVYEGGFAFHQEIRSKQVTNRKIGRFSLLAFPKKTAEKWPRATKEKKNQFVSFDYDKVAKLEEEGGEYNEFDIEEDKFDRINPMEMFAELREDKLAELKEIHKQTYESIAALDEKKKEEMLKFLQDNPEALKDNPYVDVVDNLEDPEPENEDGEQ